MRSIEYLAQLFPDKTGKELFELQSQDKADDLAEYEKENQHKLDLIKDINENGGYYKGTFGLNQKFMYSFTNMELIGGDIMCDVKHIVAFTDDETHSIIRDIKVDNKSYEQFERYGTSFYTRINKDEFDSAVNYINAIQNLW